MGGLAAVFNRGGAPIDPDVVSGMLAASPHRSIHGQDAFVSGPIALAHQHFWVTPEEIGEHQPVINDAGYVLVCDARLDNRQQLIATLRIGTDPSEVSDASIILSAYERWNLGCVERLEGEFALVLWDASAQRLLLARDRLGGRELHYYLSGTCCVVASEVKQVLVHPDVPRRLNEGRIAEHLAGAWRTQEETFYADVHSLAPAHWLVVFPQTTVKGCYWELDLTERIRYRRDEDYAEHFAMLTRDSVRDRLRTTGPVGISLSGGLDSSSVAALAAPIVAGEVPEQCKLKSFSYVFDTFAECDEREFIKQVVKRFDLEAHYLPSDHRWTLNNFDQWPSSPEGVMGDAFVLLFLSVLEAARDSGCRLLLNGQYGDVLFAGGRYWAASQIRERRLRTLITTMASSGNERHFRRDLGVYGLWQLTPRLLKHAYRRARPLSFQTLHPGVDPSLAARTDLFRRMNYGGEIPAGVAADRWERSQGLLKNGWAVGISLVREFTHRYRLEIAMPLWDRRLVEYVLAVPADQLGWPKQTRRMQRTSMAGLLPDAVRLRPGKTSFYPLFVAGLLHHQCSTVEHLITDPQVVQRGWVRADWLRSELAAGEAWSQHGYPFWQALSLEMWLRRYWPT